MRFFGKGNILTSQIRSLKGAVWTKISCIGWNMTDTGQIIKGSHLRISSLKHMI